MADSDDIRQSIIDSAKTGIQRVRVGHQDVEMASVDDQLKALTLASDAADDPAFGLRFTKLIPPGCGYTRADGNQT
jgi:hypothetical protein